MKSVSVALASLQQKPLSAFWAFPMYLSNDEVKEFEAMVMQSINSFDLLDR